MVDSELTQINTPVRNKNNIVERDEKQTSNDAYTPKQRFYLAGFILMIVVILGVVCTETGNYALTELKYTYPINFRMYVSFIQMPFVFMFLGYYHLMGYGLMQKIKTIGLDTLFFGIGSGITCALFGIIMQNLSPHFMMIIDSIALPIEFLILVIFLSYKFNIWKALTITTATVAIIVCAVVMNIYFQENPQGLQSMQQNILEGIVVSIILNCINILGDLVLYHFRERYNGRERPLLDTILFFMLMSPFSTITQMCCCAIARESFSFPQDPRLWGCVALYSCCEMPCLALSFYLIYLMDPIYLRIGTLCRIPIIFIVDYIGRNILVHPIEIVGATVIMLSIIGYELISWYEKPSDNKNEILVEESNEALVRENNEKKKEKEAVDVNANGGETSIEVKQNSITLGSAPN